MNQESGVRSTKGPQLKQSSENFSAQARSFPDSVTPATPDS
jgi:hypothetical protein